ncbi:antibiotic biosynthesis monooxygenase family protein [Sphingobium sp. WCS2017Hpa-17]|uniref:putative quinol monooxygenase n=1 Tax=Sphingobium sp. WCS2017Hpa-17 TaxID=3073638 RepID=UPI00288ACEF0|nr:antibiotic biosynthesis monooxygenase family protein [Sphingobium sp. WCS2017Hpa-17]
MIKEIAQLQIEPDQAIQFEAAVVEAIPHFRDAKGCHGLSLERSVDVPGAYMLVVRWDSVDAHMIDFRGSPAFAAWRELVGVFFTAAPQVDHVEQAIDGF